MTELTVTETRSGTCPPWCVTEKTDTGTHTHASLDARVETLGRPLTVQLVQVVDSEPRMLVDGQVATIEQAANFANAIKRLTDAGTLAEPGLTFVLQLAARSGITLEEMALGSGLDVERLRTQRTGAQVMTVHEMDRLALTVANLSTARNRS